MRFTEIISEAGSPAQQAAIAIAMKKAGKKPKSESVAESDLDRFKKYTRPVVKTTPKIEKDNNPSGRTTDHVEWKVTTPTGEIHRYNSKKQAQEKFDSFGQQDVTEGLLNELDMFAPVTTYVRLANGEYVVASWRRNQNLSGGNKASFIDIKPLSPTVAKQLGLDQRLNDTNKNYTDVASIASGGGVQSSTPFDDKTINVVDIMDPKFAKDMGVPDAVFGKIAQWGQQQDVAEGVPKIDIKKQISKFEELALAANRAGDDAKCKQYQQKIQSLKQKMSQDVAEGENWSKHNNKRAGGMSKKSVASYRRSHPGSKIQTAVTTKPSKLKKGSKAAKRRASFCARMRGMKKHRTGAKTANDPNSNINKSLRRWHCESIEELQELVMLAEQFIQQKKKTI